MNDEMQNCANEISSENEDSDKRKIVIDLGEETDDIADSATTSIASLGQSMAKIQNSYIKNIEPLMERRAMLDNMMSPILEQKTKISAMMAPILKQQELLSSITAPLQDIQSTLALKSMELISPAIQSYYQGISASISESIRPILDSYKPLMSNTLTNLISSYQFDLVDKIQIPIRNYLETIDFSPLYSIFEAFKGFDVTKYRDKLNKIAIAETYNARWFPHALCLDDREMVAEFWSILDSTRKSKNRIKKIDQLVFSRYDKNRIEETKKAWCQKNIPEHKMRMMHQAVQAYHRREYALTVVMLSTLWEGIIYDKMNDFRGKSGKRTKEDFKRLISQTDYDALFASFFDEYIMYDCRSVAEVKEDVPGRNSSVHSWYSKYPSRKAGLNAILFTDFLINLEPLEEIENG